MKRLSLTCALLALVCWAVVAQSVVDGVVDVGEYPSVADLGPVRVYWRVDGAHIQIALECRTTGWVALGIEPEQAMQGADMIFGWVDDRGAHVLDCYSTDVFGPHPPDTELGGSNDILSFAARESDGVTMIELVRPLDAVDDYDKPLSRDGETRLIWAYGSGDDFEGFHAETGFATISLAAGGGASIPGRGLLILHAILMSMGFAAMSTGMILARYFKKTVKKWLKTHKLLGPAGGVLALIALGIAVYMIERVGGAHIKVWHAGIGIVTLSGIVLTPMAGQGMLTVKTFRKQIRTTHRWLGRITLLAMLTTIVLGILRALGVS